MGRGQYNGLGEYCDPYTASSVFLILSLIKQITSKKCVISLNGHVTYDRCQIDMGTLKIVRRDISFF